MSRIAIVKVRKEPHYRRQAIESGLLRCGFELRDKYFSIPAPPEHTCIHARSRND